MAAVVDAIPLSKDAHGVYRAGGMRVTLELLRGTLCFHLAAGSRPTHC